MYFFPDSENKYRCHRSSALFMSDELVPASRNVVYLVMLKDAPTNLALFPFFIPRICGSDSYGTIQMEYINGNER